MSEAQRAYYTREGERFVPTGHGKSFWDETRQGGAPLAGLAAQLLGALPAPVPMLPARLTIDLLGAAPMAALTARTRLIRDGRRVQLLGIELEADGRSWVSATMLRVRLEGEGRSGEGPLHPFPDGATPLRRVLAESIRLEGDERTPGPGALWMRVITPMIAGEAIDPLASVAAAADWGTSVAPPADPAEWTYASLDLSISLSRMPASDWLLLAGRSEVAGNGAGYVDMRMGDLAGMFGSVHQSIFMSRR